MVKYYLYFPEDDHEILKTDEDFITKLFDFSNLLKNDSEVYYDENNIETYKQRIKVLGVYLDDAILRLRIKLFKISAKSINIRPIVKTDCVYVQWNYDVMPKVNYTKPIISDLAERSFLYPNEKLLLLNLNNVINTCREKILVFKDAKHLLNMPSNFAKIDFVTDANELKIWQSTHDKSTFTLLDRTRFNKTNMIQQGKPVFEEITTGNYWYLDNFHKNEYEVFDNTHHHVGVADLNGIIDITQKTKGRIF